MQKVQLATGVTFAYDDIDCTEPWLPSEPVVLVHGFSKNRKFWFEWIPTFAARYRTIVPDLRGHGDSTPLPPGFSMSFKPFIDDLAAFLDALGLESAHFVMAEFASVVAIEFANAYADLIRSLTLPGFLYKASGIDFDRWRDLLESGGVAAWAQDTNNLRLPPDADPLKKAWYIEQQSRFSTAFMLNFIEFGRSMDLTSRLPGITMPALVMTGENASQEPADVVIAGAKLIPDCKVRIIENAPLNIMSARPAETMRHTLDFLSEVRARAE